jgi:hypothetical protein
MKRSLILLAVLFLLLGVFVQASLAYSTATGCVVDGYGNPWTHGGLVTVEYPAGTGNYLSYQTNLDPTTGCFDAQLWPSGDHEAGTLHIDPAPGPAGDPDEFLCQVPADNTTGNYDCGTMQTNTSPNAVVVNKMSVSSGPNPLWISIAIGMAGLLAVLVVAVIWRRRTATIAR